MRRALEQKGHEAVNLSNIEIDSRPGDGRPIIILKDEEFEFRIAAHVSGKTTI
jgi:hypothetical protein